MANMEQSKFSLKFDDILIKLLGDYHDLCPSEIASFFGQRAKQMLECEPNITEKNKQPKIVFDNHKGRTAGISNRHIRLKNIEPNGKKIYVLRGFYPDTHIPFKMTLVGYNNQWDEPTFAAGKVTLGMKEHHTRIDEKEISVYEESVSEALLLNTLVPDEMKVQYEYRKFRCMRPKGMELYHESEKKSSS